MTQLSEKALQLLKELQELAEVEGEDEMFNLGYPVRILDELDELLDYNVRGEYRISDAGRAALQEVQS
jgi:hypothetical protein